MVQRASEGHHYGDTNPDHTKAVSRTIQYWNDEAHPRFGNWRIDESWVEQYDQKFIREHKLKESGRDHFFHIVDIALFEWIEDRPVLKLVIELDGPSHDSPNRQISDGIFEEWIGKKYKGYVKVIRINIRELVGPYNLACEHLKSTLLEFII
ncbi:MAG TPA: hypothetical protein VF220_02970 [Nitrososphaeraceae archaeon]